MKETSDIDVQVFYLKKCDPIGENSAFWTWCIESDFNETITTDCELEGKSGCQVKLRFVNETALWYREKCKFGPNPKKDQILNKTVALKDDLTYVKDFCREALYGSSLLPVWLIILIVLLVLIAVSIAFALLWKFRLRRMLYPTKEELASGVSSVASSNSAPSKLPPVRQVSRSRSTSRRARGVASYNAGTLSGQNVVTKRSSGVSLIGKYPVKLASQTKPVLFSTSGTSQIRGPPSEFAPSVVPRATLPAAPQSHSKSGSNRSASRKVSQPL